MIKALQLWRNNGKAKRQQDIKNRILKNEEVILEGMGKRAKGAKTCSFYMGATCVADACQFFNGWKSLPDANGKVKTTYACDFNKTPVLIVELLNEQRRTNRLLEAIAQTIVNFTESKK